jgi:hypothetical protein
VEVSAIDIKARIEQILSEILSDKHEAKITIRFGESGEDSNGDYDTSGNIGEKQILDQQTSSL